MKVIVHSRWRRQYWARRWRRRWARSAAAAPTAAAAPAPGCRPRARSQIHDPGHHLKKYIINISIEEVNLYSYESCEMFMKNIYTGNNFFRRSVTTFNVSLGDLDLFSSSFAESLFLTYFKRSKRFITRWNLLLLFLFLWIITDYSRTPGPILKITFVLYFHKSWSHKFHRLYNFRYVRCSRRVHILRVVLVSKSNYFILF